MGIPPNIRVNTRIGFPALVYGLGPIVVTRANGIFQILLNYMGLAAQNPISASLATDFLLVYDSIAGQFIRVPLSFFGTGGARTQRSVVNATVTITTLDQILNLSLNAPQNIALPAASLRGGGPLTFNDATGAIGANVNPITLTALASAGDTIEGQANFVMRQARQLTTLIPYNDGVNTGWFFG